MKIKNLLLGGLLFVVLVTGWGFGQEADIKEIQKILDEYEKELSESSLKWIATEPGEGWLEFYELKTEGIYFVAGFAEPKEGTRISTFTFIFQAKKRKQYFCWMLFENGVFKNGSENVDSDKAHYILTKLAGLGVFSREGLSSRIQAEIKKIAGIEQ